MTVSNHLQALNSHSWSMGMVLTNAFTVGHLQQILEFHLLKLSLFALKCPSPSSPMSRGQHHNWGIIVLFHASISKVSACLKHSKFINVSSLNMMLHSEAQPQCSMCCSQQLWCSAKGWSRESWRKSNYEFFNCNNFNVHWWSWNYRGCWHQTCPPIVAHRSLKILLIPITRHYALHSYFLSLPHYIQIG